MKMTILIIYLITAALNMALMIWGQQTFAPIIPTLPPSTLNPVINGSVFVFAGEPVAIKEDMRLVIDCSPLIDRVMKDDILNQAIGSGVTSLNPTVTWIKDGFTLSNGSLANIIISADRRRLIITDTLLAAGGQSGTSGNYTCDVCTDFIDPNCSATTPVYVCVEPNLMPPIGPPSVSPTFISITCGQDAEIASLESVFSLIIQCIIFNGLDLVPQVFKDGVLIGSSFPLTIVSPTDDDFGTYTFALTTERCGSTQAVSRIIRQGDPPDIDEGPFEGLPSAVPPGDRTVTINTPAYIVDGFNLTLVCNIASGTRPITIMWLRDGQPYPAGGNNSVMTVSDYTDGEVFTCRAENVVGFDMENTTVNVFEPPQILPIDFPTPPPGETTVSTGQPSNTTVETGTSVTIFCPSSGIDTPDIQWFRNGAMVVDGGRFRITTPILPGAVITSALRIDDFQPATDSGTYTCRSTNIVGLADGGTTLLGDVCPSCPPPGFVTPNPDGCPICGFWETGDYGPCSTPCQTGNQTRMVQCSVMGKLAPEDQCDPGLRPRSERFCNQHIKCFHDPPDIDEGPFIPLPPTLPPGDMMVMIGAPAYIVDGFDLTIVCNIANGTRPITIMWLHDGQPYPAGGNNSIITISDYTDGEVFTCRANNIVGFDMENTTVIVFASPQIYVHPQAKIVEINNDSTSVTFVCMAYEASSYYWLRETGSIPSDASGVKTNKLTLHSILPLDSGRYQCVAENEHGETYSNYAMFTVIALPPMVRIESKAEIKVRRGERVEFVCSATGVGSVYFIYQWFLNGLPINDQDTSTLVIDAVLENDAGNYKCFVRNQYNGTGQSEEATLVLDQLCDPVTVNYTGFSIIWNETRAGVTAEALCTGHGLNGTVRRRCIRDHLWEEFFDCFRQETKMLLDQAINLTSSLNELNETEKIITTSNIANALVNVTAPTQEPIFAQDINLAVNTLSALNNATETFIDNLMINDTFFEDTTSVINNLLSDTNQESWKQLERSSPSTSQDLVRSAEQITRLLSKTLTNNSTKATKTRPNIIINAERVTNDSVHEGYIFPNEDDNLTAYNGGRVQIMVSSNTLQNISSQELTIASTVIRNGSGLRLPSSDDRLGDPISPIFSLEINPLPNLQILAENPIMLMFDVDQNATLSEQNIVQDDTVYDVSCNFYDNSLVTNDNLNQVGGWSTNGLTVDRSQSNETLVTCLTTHLTSFAVLVSIQDERPPSTANKTLSIISYIGCSISLVFLCISIILLSYTFYKAKGNKNHLFIHLNLCIALALGLVVFISGIENATRWEESCKFVAALLQYLFISAFCWMLCEGVILYMMLVTVFGNKLNKRRFFFVLGWGPALLVVGISAGIAHENYGTDYYCWITSNDGAIVAFIAPIVAIMLINCVFFAITLRVLCQQKIKNNSNKDTVKNVLKASVLLLPLLGMTWIIGIFAVNNDTQVFAWIFAILNSLQGVFIFLLHVIRNKQVVKEMRGSYNFMRRSEMFSRLHSLHGSGTASSSRNSSKARTLQNTSSEGSDPYKNVSTTTSGFSSKALEMSLKDEAFKDNEGGQKKLTTLEESIFEEGNVGVVRKDLTEEDKKSITKQDGEAISSGRNDPDKRLTS